MALSVTDLPFDSELFGYPVGRLDVDPTVQDIDLQKIAGACMDKRLVYVFSPSPLAHLGLSPVDIRQTYYKSMPFVPDWTNPMAVKYNDNDLESVIALAFVSGRHSRFATDPRFENNEFRKLYRIWIERSLNYEIADTILVTHTDNEISGLVTLATGRDHEMKIGLVAVADNRQGRGLGSALLNGVMQQAVEHGATKISVVTQSSNEAACRLYRKFGFELRHEVYVHHLWAD